MNQELKNKFLAGYAGTFLVTYEEKRVEAEMLAIAKDIGYRVYSWTITDSMIGPMDAPVFERKVFRGEDGSPLDAIQLLDKMNEYMPEKSILLAKDYHFFVSEPNPILVRKMKDALSTARNNMRRFVILGCQFKLVPELEKEFTVVEFALPGKDQLKVVAEGIASSAGIALNGSTDALLDAASGMTTIEAEDAFSLAWVESGKKDIPPAIVAREKAHVVKKSGILEIINTDLDWTKVGGNDLVKEWVSKRQKAFTKEAIAYNLPRPKGVLLIGVPGTGKSLIAKAVANILQVPLLKLDGGKLFGSLVGQSEQNSRTMIQTAEAVAPCVLWCDELEKSLSGSKSSNMTDGGTSARVMGTMLQWLQDKTSPVFVVATANDISALPPELLRKGRWDEMFFVDLPNEHERKEIAEVVIRKFGRKPDDYDTFSISGVTDGFTGAEIEGAYTEAMFEAFSESREPTTEDVLVVCSKVVPIQTTMREQIEALRKWCDGRARRASEKVVAVHPNQSHGRKLK